MPGIKNDLTIYKCDSKGEILWQYQGRLISHEAGKIILEAAYNRDDTLFEGIILKNNDLFIETFHTERWYNIFEIQDRDDGHLKGWYCNVGRPAVLKENMLRYDDLALDLWVTPEGIQKVMDEDEFADLELDEETRRNAMEGLAQLHVYFYQKFND